MRVLLALMLLCGFCMGASAQPLQPGDTIAVSVYQDPKLDRQILIPPSGIISFPLAGQLRAGGVTPQALETALRARLKDKFASDLDITVSLVSLRTPEKVEEKPERPIEEELKPRVYVTGEVLRPGHHVIRTRLNVLQAISLSGGFGIFAAKQRIQIRRRVNGAEVMYLFDYDAFFSGRNVATNLDLLPGDVVIVPERGPFE
jgi:polysaccharide export outer membrane protein